MTMSDDLSRLSALDWQFLGIEDKSNTHMHIGSLLVFEGPPPATADLRRFIEGRIGLAPRFRQKLVMHPTDGGKPVWADDSSFDIQHHVRAVGLPRPAGQAELEELVGDIFSARLDRAKPMWRMWRVDGLPHDGWALVMKMHHSMVDGLGAIELFAALLDITPEPRDVELEDFDPADDPRRRDVVTAQARRGARTARDMASGVGSMVRNPTTSVPKIYDLAKGMVETADAALPLPVSTPLNVETSPHRGFHTRTYSLADFKAIRRALGGSINDVVLTVTADALGRYLSHHGMETDGVEIRAEVPSAVRDQSPDNQAGNVFVVLAVQLPIGPMTPSERFGQVSGRMTAVKDSGMATAVGAILSLTDFFPPTILAQTSRLFFGKMLFNVLVSNVPGVQIPVYLNGSKLVRMSPLPWVGPQQALSVAVISYDGQMGFGFMVDRDVVRDTEVFGDFMDAAVSDLVAAADQERGE
jgi:WS/DGAT/MGAT family acyltransferase